MITGRFSVSIGQWNVNRGHRNVIMRPWHVNRHRGMCIGDCAM